MEMTQSLAQFIPNAAIFALFFRVVLAACCYLLAYYIAWLLFSMGATSKVSEREGFTLHIENTPFLLKFDLMTYRDFVFFSLT